MEIIKICRKVCAAILRVCAKIAHGAEIALDYVADKVDVNDVPQA